MISVVRERERRRGEIAGGKATFAQKKIMCCNSRIDNLSTLEIIEIIVGFCAFQNVIPFNAERTAASDSHPAEYELCVKLILVSPARPLDEY